LVVKHKVRMITHDICMFHLLTECPPGRHRRLRERRDHFHERQQSKARRDHWGRRYWISSPQEPWNRAIQETSHMHLFTRQRGHRKGR
jgi:hypothetical protein